MKVIFLNQIKILIIAQRKTWKKGKNLFKFKYKVGNLKSKTEMMMRERVTEMSLKKTMD